MKVFPHPKKIKTKLLSEFAGKQILDLSRKRIFEDPKDLTDIHTMNEVNHDLTQFPWPIADDAYDLIIFQNVIEHLPDTGKTFEELNRITKSKGKIFIETPHFTWFETYRHFNHCHRFSFCSFDHYLKGNPFYKTDFQIMDKYLFFDDLLFFLGIGFLANFFPRHYEKRLAFIFPATSFQITLCVDK